MNVEIEGLSFLPLSLSPSPPPGYERGNSVADPLIGVDPSIHPHRWSAPTASNALANLQSVYLGFLGYVSLDHCLLSKVPVLFPNT